MLAGSRAFVEETSWSNVLCVFLVLSAKNVLVFRFGFLGNETLSTSAKSESPYGPRFGATFRSLTGQRTDGLQNFGRQKNVSCQCSSDSSPITGYDPAEPRVASFCQQWTKHESERSGTSRHANLFRTTGEDNAPVTQQYTLCPLPKLFDQ